MKHKLLNFSKNLIISIILVVIVMMLFFTTSSCAASGDTLGKLMRQSISEWYRTILKFSLIVYLIGYLIILIKVLIERTPEKIKLLKESMVRFILMLVVIYCLHYIMIAIFIINEDGINVAKSVGTKFSGIDMQNDEYDLYETALSKAYEIEAVPGFIGLIMYLLLVYYTYKFVFVYAKRYINIIVLILIAPILFVVSTIKKIITGVSDGRILRWFKEFIFNVIIQVFHAVFYSILIGFTLKMSDNNENLIGALLTLIVFGFIFKIDSIIRKIFNFVGGSTKIRNSSITNVLSSSISGGISSGLGAIESGANRATLFASNASESIKEKGFSQAFKDGSKEAWANTKVKFKELPSQAWDKAMDAKDHAVEKAKSGIINTGKNIQSSARRAYANAKEDVKDLDNILNGERVKAKLTADEIAETMHIMEEAEGLEGLRQDIRHVGIVATSKVDKLLLAGKEAGLNFEARMARAKRILGRRLSAGVDAALEEAKKDKERLDNTVEVAKRIPKFFRKLTKKKKYVRTADGMNLDVDNAMAVVIDTDCDINGIIQELKEQMGDDIDVSAFVFEKIGAQTFLSPAMGSPRMGMSVLAEEKYEEIAEHKVEELITGQKREKRRIRMPATIEAKLAVRKAGKILDKSNKVNKIGLVKKTYKFSRFTPDTARKITNRMLDKSRKNNRYVFVITKAYTDIQLKNMKPRGRISNKVTEINHTIRATRKNVVKSIRKIKLDQLAAIAQNKELTRRTRAIEMANNVAGQLMTATNTIRLGFKKIDNMTPGQVGLRKMIKEGKAKELASGLIAVRQKVSAEDKIKVTGIFNPEENIVRQFVITQAGKIAEQFVTTDGRIVKPAETEDGQIVHHRIIKEKTPLQDSNTNITHIRTTENIAEIQPNVERTSTEQEKTEYSENISKIIQHIVTLDGKIVEQVINNDDTIDTDKYRIINSGGDMLVQEVQASINNNELGLDENATLEQKSAKFNELLEDMQRTSNTQPLLTQVLEESTPEEREMDELLIGGMNEAGITSVSELKQLKFEQGLDEEGLKKKEAFEQFITNQMVTTGILTATEAEDDDIVGDALNVLNNRVQEMSSSDTERLFNTAAEMERVKIAESLLKKGEFTINNPPTKESIDEKADKLSDLLTNLAKDYIEETTRFPREVLKDTAEGFVEVIKNAEEGRKTEAELQFEKELEKAEKKWAKKHKKESDKDIVKKYNKQEKGQEEGVPIKISFKFYGGVENQGQQVTLSNHYSIKDFYDKANKLDDANLKKTQERFLQLYGNELSEMQLLPFSFSKCPVEKMDGWSIYIVTDKEDTTQGEKTKVKEEGEEPKKEISEDIRFLLEKYFNDIKKIFKQVVQKYEISEFEELYKSKIKDYFIRMLRTFLARQGEKAENEKSRDLFVLIMSDKRFKKLFEEIRFDKKSEETASNAVKNAPVDTISREDAEAYAESEITQKDFESFIKGEKENLIDQVLNAAMTEQEKLAQSSEDVRNLLNQLNENKVYISTDFSNKEDKKVLRFL